MKYGIGSRISVTPRGDYKTDFHGDGSTYTRFVQQESFTTTVLAVCGTSYVCEGKIPLDQMSEQVQQACKDAGVSPDARVQLVWEGEVDFDLPPDVDLSKFYKQNSVQYTEDYGQRLKELLTQKDS